MKSQHKSPQESGDGGVQSAVSKILAEGWMALRVGVVLVTASYGSAVILGEPELTLHTAVLLYNAVAIVTLAGMGIGAIRTVDDYISRQQARSSKLLDDTDTEGGD